MNAVDAVNAVAGEDEGEIRRMKLEIASLQMELEMEKKKKSVESTLQLDIRGVM